MTGDIPPPTRRTPEELIALLIAALMAVVSSLIDVTFLPTNARNRLHEAFADHFARLEAAWIKLIQQQRERTASKQPEPTNTLATEPVRPAAPVRRQRTKTTPIPNAPQPASALTAISPITEAPHLSRAPAPHHPTRATFRAVASSTKQAVLNPSANFQNAAFTTRNSRAHFVTIS